jgi:release factor glutamine methyltransferase
MSNINSLLKKYSKKVPLLDLELLLSFVLKKNREYILTHPEETINLWQFIKIKYFINQLIKHKPLNYILGYKEFYGLNFLINKHTLIPRPETELLVEKSLQLIKKQKNWQIWEIGTGSGNIIISLATALPKLSFPKQKLWASDISKSALKIAKKNAKKNYVSINFLQGDLLQPFYKYFYIFKRKRDNLLIIANLPYLSKKIYSQTAINVKKYEPVKSLISGPDGLQHYRRLFKEVSQIQKTKMFKQIHLLIEISPEQKSILKKDKFIVNQKKIIWHQDLSQKWRILQIKL